MNFTYRKFQPETDTLKPFDCGDTDLNGFLVETSQDTPNATMYERERLFPPLFLCFAYQGDHPDYYADQTYCQTKHRIVFF